MSPSPALPAASSQPARTRADRCPGVSRPWPAPDGLLVRVRLIGGHLPSTALERLLTAAERFGDGRIHLTSRANLQVRGFPGTAAYPDVEAKLSAEALAALWHTGLMPAPSHDLVRNIMVSPQSGLAAGAADLRPTARRLDTLLCQNPRLATLPAKFSFVLDDGRGDLVDTPCDLGLVALDRDNTRLRIGRRWGPVISLEQAPDHLIHLALAFLDARGTGSSAPWHIHELSDALTGHEAPTRPAELPAPGGALPFGLVPGGDHVPVPGGVLDRTLTTRLAQRSEHVVVTPWRGVLVPAEGGPA